MNKEALLQALVVRIHSFPEFAGCPIGYQGEGQSRTLYEGSSHSPNSSRIAFAIEFIEESNPAYVDEIKRLAEAPGLMPPGGSEPALLRNRSKVWGELGGTLVSCGATVVSGLGIFGSVAAEVPTAGASTILLVASWTGFITGGVQCLNGAVRTGQAVFNPEGTEIDYWDNDPYYKDFFQKVDYMSLGSGAVGTGYALRNLTAVVARQNALLARNLDLKSLGRLGKHERMKIIKEMVEEAGKTPEGRAALEAAAKEIGVKDYALRGTTLSSKHAFKMTKVVTAETTKRLNASLGELIAQAVSVTANAMPSSITGSSSGTLNNWIVHVMES